MGDSEDEFERRNVREKFRHERSDYEQRDDRRGREPDRSSWGNRNRDRRDYRDNDRNHRDRRSPPGRHDSSPPQMKRMRRDWDEGGYPHYDHPYGPPMHGPPRPMWGPGGELPPPPPPGAMKAPEPEFPTQPPMMSFKQFLVQQDDNITDEEAIKRYNDFKMDFKKQQINEFFIQHKEEEWFRSKYYPDEYMLRQEEMITSLKNRCDVFKKLVELKIIDTVSVDMSCQAELVRLLDSAVIFMEGGTEFDLKSLDMEEVGSGDASVLNSSKNEEDVKSNENVEKPSDVINNEIKDKEASGTGEPVKVEDGAIKEAKEEKPKAKQNGEKTTSGRKKERYHSGSESDDSSSSSSSDGEMEDEEPAKKEDNAGGDSNLMETSEVKPEVEADDKEPKPQAHHKTLSIFLRNLIPAITKQEVEAMCKRYPGFMRVSIQDPQPERRFARRGWVTFNRNVNIKDICWSLNNLRLRDCDMGAIVNRELRQRVRAVNGLTVHRSVAKQDIKHAAKIIQNMDNRWKLWADSNDEKKDEEKMSFGFVSNNPVLKNITDYLVDEGSYEEEVLLGEVSKDKEGGADITIERDEELLKVLDRMLLYLRIVYSIDYYGTFEYPNEDEMPHRCGIIHARGLNTVAKITQNDANEWMSSFELKISALLNPKFQLDDAETVKLGKKNQDEEVEKFINANMQELGKDKWLCSLSGKKFKGPEFVRKHILTKHTEKIEEVKKEVGYFNNYLSDPRRLQLPEHPTARQSVAPPPPAMMPGFLAPPPHPGFYRPPPVYPVRRAGAMYPPHFPVRAPENYRNEVRREREPVLPRRDRSRPDPRAVISYTDLDAPPEVD